MDRLWSLVLCALVQAACCGAESAPQQAVGSSSLLSRSCNDSDVLATASLALQHINRHRRDGFVLGLNRMYDVWEHRQANQGSLFYLTMEVYETSCHVLSRRNWEDCERVLSSSAYGQCKAVFYQNKPKRVSYLPAYNCTLLPGSASKFRKLCFNCFTRRMIDFSHPEALEAAIQSLTKYNSRSTSKQYSLIKVIRASLKWLHVARVCYVQYLIRESPCNESQSSNCSSQPSNSKPVGHCAGQLLNFYKGPSKSSLATCEFFEPQVQAPRGENASSSLAKPTPLGSIQYFPEFNYKAVEAFQEDEDSPETFTEMFFLTTDPQGIILDISFLFPGSQQEKLVVLPFPRERSSAKCPGSNLKSMYWARYK